MSWYCEEFSADDRPNWSNILWSQCLQCAVHLVTNSVTIGLWVSFGVILQQHVHCYCCSHYYYCKSAGIYCLIITHCLTFDIYLSSQLAAVLMVWWWCSIACCKMWKHDWFETVSEFVYARFSCSFSAPAEDVLCYRFLHQWQTTNTY